MTSRSLKIALAVSVALNVFAAAAVGAVWVAREKVGAWMADARRVPGGQPVWEVSVLVKEDGARPELEQVAVPSAQQPVLPFGPCRFEGLVARPWLFNGRAGTALSASSVTSLVTAAKRGE